MAQHLCFAHLSNYAPCMLFVITYLFLLTPLLQHPTFASSSLMGEGNLYLTLHCKDKTLNLALAHTKCQ